MARAFEPQLATLAATPPEGPRWSYEIKYDGYRALASSDGRDITLRARGGRPYPSFPDIVSELRALSRRPLVLDGELCALDGDGCPRFARLQAALSERAWDRLLYFVFDVLVHDGVDLRAAPLTERRVVLDALLPRTDHGAVRRVVSHEGSGADFLAATAALGLEGLVAKRLDRPYRSGRSRDWVKVKIAQRAELVVVGFTEPSGTRDGVGALLLGARAGGGLRYAGKVGSGFDDATLRALRRELEPRVLDTPPVLDPPRLRGARWVRPSLAVEVRFSEWTDEGRLRHPVFVALRADPSKRSKRA